MTSLYTPSCVLEIGDVCSRLVGDKPHMSV